MKYRIIWLAFAAAFQILCIVQIFRSQWQLAGIDVAISMACHAHYKIERLGK